MLLGGGGKLLSEGHFEGLLAAADASPRELAKMKSKLDVIGLASHSAQPNLAAYVAVTVWLLSGCGHRLAMVQEN
jgi:hypothetical protein